MIVLHIHVLKRLNITLQKAEALRDAQFREQFPQNEEMKKMFNLEATFDFGPFINALTNASDEDIQGLMDFLLGVQALKNLNFLNEFKYPDNELSRELQRFWAHFPEDRLKSKGLHFPYGDYLLADQTLYKHFRDWGSHVGIRTRCFVQLILGGLQRRADPTFARVLKTGVYYFLSHCSVTPSCASDWSRDDVTFFAARGAANQGIGFTTYCNECGVIGPANYVTPLNEALLTWANHGVDNPADHSRDPSLEGLFKQTMDGIMACGPKVEVVPEPAPTQLLK